MVDLRSGRDSGGGDGVVGGVSGEAGVCAGVAWSLQVIRYHTRPPPSPIRRRLAPILRWRPPPCLVYQGLPRLSRSNYPVFPRECWKYGASDGYPSQHGITKDAQAALDHLSQRGDIDTSRILIFGRSLGGAVGSMLAKNNPDKVAALILENTFTSVLDLAGVVLPFLKWFIGHSSSKGPKILNFLVRSPWSTIDIIGQVKQPILFLSGLQDEMVPPSHMQLLYAKAAAHNKKCIFVEFPSGMHMDTWLSGGDNYWRTIQQFLEEHVPEKDEKESS
ncbi:alpha/beta hydrolase domain-containing protein WAV2-like isoform X2 [Tripterygium wilfordii]|uniref:alpha/beta hydrolase domain-containing protein WAV2-like isoform X2 n=1 Tax=Tripterygium wilfordii TaxID=458696 RepID=UPI0018F82557|nr:alpha/beta hydrolase domain-containing protein WAV2-like isoform X2 [Tripterygium wilfordii]